MGADKALVPFRGEPMLRHVVNAIGATGLEVLIVGREGPFEGHRAIPDIADAGYGPAAGLLTALSRHDVRDVFLVAVDQPLLRPATISGLLATPGDAVVPIANGHPQVTCAVYRAPCLEPLRSYIAGGGSKLRRLLDLVATTRVEEDTWSKWGEGGGSWLSLDTLQAVEEAEALRCEP